MESENVAAGVRSDQERVEWLAKQILHHKRCYYSGESEIPDQVYDALEDELRELSPTHPVLNAVGSDFFKPELSRAKVEHHPPMLSLAKTYEALEVARFIEKYTDVVVSDKLDGMALSIEYGHDGVFQRASTRGSGRLGEDVSRHVLLIPHIPKSLPQLPALDIGSQTPTRTEVRGEVFFPTAQFQQVADRFESFRNAVPGTFGRKEPYEARELLQRFEFCAYDILFVKEGEDEVVFPYPTHFEKLKHLERMGFFTGASEGQTLLLQASEWAGRLEDLAAYLEQVHNKVRPYAIDGLVFRCNSEAVWHEQGATAHHPRASLAFKRTGETAVTELEDIVVGVGRSGKISFRAKLRPVSLSGATISYATLHNADFVQQGGYSPGARVKLKRSGEVIPYIIGLEEPAPTQYSLPESCLCGSPLTRKGPDLFCLDNSACPYRDTEATLYFVRSLEIYGVSERILQKLREAGLLTCPSDLFRMTKADLLSLEGFKEKLAENVYSSIQEKTTLSLATFLTALGLRRGGKVKCEEVANHFGSLDVVRRLTVAELSELKGWAEKSAGEFLDSLREKEQLVNDLLEFITIMEPGEQVSEIGSPNLPLTGLKFCITGALSRPRSVIAADIKAKGGQVVSSVSSETSYLVTNEASLSSKYRKAQSLGIPIIDEDRLATLLMGS